MSEFNPYAPPAARVAGAPPLQSEVWREGGEVVLARGGDLPPRCVKCNAPVYGDVRSRRLSWHTPWLLLLLLLNLLIYVIVAALASKRVVLSPALCAEHRSQRLQVLVGAWLGFLFGAGLLYIGIDRSSPALGLAGAAVIIAAMVFGMVRGRIVYLTRVDQYQIRLKGCGREFLDSLPRR